MQIFTSWSGERSKAAALGLRSLLQDLFEDAVDVFISEHINPGEAWAVRLGRELEESEFGIICITQENAHAPWLLFEAGAIAKKFGTSLVVPYLVDEPSSIPVDSSPLGQFQHVRADRAGTYRLVESINKTIRPSKPVDRLERSFSRWWPDLEETLKGVQSENPMRAQRSDRELLESVWHRVDWLYREQVRFRESGIMYLPHEELKHMQNLSRRPSMTYARSGTVQAELRHLRDLGLIRNSRPITDLPEHFRLDEWVYLTDKGIRYLRESEPSKEAGARDAGADPEVS
jgi:hypothetical protein